LNVDYELTPGSPGLAAEPLKLAQGEAIKLSGSTRKNECAGLSEKRGKTGGDKKNGGEMFMAERSRRFIGHCFLPRPRKRVKRD
jgi:hypothetical protein